MILVEWNQFLPPNAKLKFSCLAFSPFESHIDSDLVYIELDGTDKYIDVEWVNDLQKFVVTLNKDDFVIEREECLTAEEVIPIVVVWCERFK
jgi:hypothetical protein